MSALRNPGRVAGLWYVLLVFFGPLRLIYIPNKLFVLSNPALTASNLVAHEWLFRLGMVSDLAGAVVLVMLVLAFYRLFESVDRVLAVQVVFFGGVMPSMLYFVNSVGDGAALMIARGAPFLSAFSRPQQEALVVLFLRLHSQQNIAAETLWGVWLIPLGMLVYRSRFLPRFFGWWLVVNGVAYVILSLTGLLAPQYADAVFRYGQPVFLAELGFTLWLVVKGATPSAEVIA